MHLKADEVKIRTAGLPALSLHTLYKKRDVCTGFRENWINSGRKQYLKAYVNL